MASFTNFVLHLLLTITLIIVIEAAQERQSITFEEEKRELERQLKAINKPALKSFKTNQGDVFDCIDIHKQLASDHHLLKNHSVQLMPTTVHEWITSNNISGKADPLQSLREVINCPDGTVIVKRTTMQDLMHAKRLRSMGFDGPRNFLTERNNTNAAGEYYVATVNFGPTRFSGVKGHINVWDPQVSQDQISLAFMAVAGGPKDHLDTIFVGWMVKPSLYHMSQDHVRLYTYWGEDYDKSGCYDITCPGFVQVSKNIPLGALLKPISVYNGSQYEIQLSLYLAWSNGLLRSSEHRVVLRKLVNRVSLAFFLCFEDEKVILAPQELVGEGNCRSYESFKCSEYLKFRQSSEVGKFERIGYTVKDFAGLKLTQSDDP